MRQRDFFKVLKRTKGWKVNQYGQIVNARGVTPVTAVANNIIKKRRFNSDYEAADYLNLPTDFILDVKFASLNDVATIDEANVRNKLLKAVQ